MREPLTLHLALDVGRSRLPEPRTGLAVAETGELMLSAGQDLHSLRLDAEGWAWLANLAAGMAAAAILERNVTPTRPALLDREVAGHA